MKRPIFPKNFFWGCSTSAHQIEGNVTNDWSAWEKSERRAQELKKKGKDPVDFIAGASCDSWQRGQQDIDCLNQLGVNAYRFSIEWSRVEPRRGEFDESAIDQYRSTFKTLRQNNIEPFVTLWHFTLPIWVADHGGWESKQTVEDFERFTKRIVEALGSDIHFWITVNEPLVYAVQSYLIGVWPPQQKSLFKTIRVACNLVAGHKQAFDAIKLHNPDSQIGLSNHSIHFSAKQPFLFNQLIARAGTYLWNQWFLNRVRNHQDFIGINYYFHKSVDFHFGKQDRIISDLQWELYPEGLGRVLRELKRFDKPIYITEHGLADRDDKHRAWYLKESLVHVAKAIEKGTDVRGYFHWSLLDNFEWADGFFPRFGLFEVDFKTCERKARPSVDVYREIIEKNGV